MPAKVEFTVPLDREAAHALQLEGMGIAGGRTASIEVDLGLQGGRHRLSAAEDFTNWATAEIEKWQWMAGNEGTDGFGIWNHFMNRISNLRDQAVNALAQGHLIQNLEYLFSNTYLANDNNTILHSDGEVGQSVLAIHRAEGPIAARAAYAFAIRRVGLAQMGQLTQLKGVMLLAVPGIVEPEALSDRLQIERRNLRERSDRLIRSLEAEAEKRRAEYVDDRRRGREIARKWIGRRFVHWQSVFDRAKSAAATSGEEFNAVRQQTEADFAALKATFLEAMHLQAPAKYWEDKAGRHRKAESEAKDRLVCFFPLALLVLAFAFFMTGNAIINHPPEANATALYVVISGGLATFAGVIFWIGRLLTKLYLSEHHLRVDAEERQIMTTTYLALTNEKAADEKDRQIILSALFRSTPDGIVRDDGPGDMGVAMLLSRLGMPGR